MIRITEMPPCQVQSGPAGSFFQLRPLLVPFIRLPRAVAGRLAIVATALFSMPVHSATVSVEEVTTDPALYSTYELRVTATGVSGNKFAMFPQMIFSRGTRAIAVEGFFNGDGNGDLAGNQWLVRFMPDEQGTWDYSWSFAGASSSGSLAVGPRVNPYNHGHVKRVGRYLQTDDGKSFLFRGANWLRTGHIRAAQDFNGLPNIGQVYVSDQELLDYLNRLRDTGHNGNFLHKMTRVMNNDRQSFDLAWLQRIDFALKASGERGIYTFLGLMNTWDRSATEPFLTEMSSSAQLLDPWNETRLQAAKELYLRYLIARYAGYYNVMWELGNEMEHSPNSGGAFASAANRFYIPWIHQYDPYDLPMTLSEGVWSQTNVDIAGFHQAQSISITSHPVVHTEIVNGGASDSMARASAYRNPSDRIHYRRVFWKGMSEGGSGSIEASNIFAGTVGFDSMTALLADQNVRNVMEDHGRLAEFVSALSNELNDMAPMGSSGIGTATLAYKSRGKSGSEYLAYFYAGVGAGVSVTLDLPSGEYVAQWFSPSSGAYSQPTLVSNGAQLLSPWANEYDAALHLTRDQQVSIPRAPVNEKLSIENTQ